MKKTWLLFPALIASLVLGGCGNKGGKESSKSEESTESSETSESSQSGRVYYVVGGFNDWTTGEDWVMTADPEDSTHFTFEGLQLAEGVGVKCTDSDGNWYPGGMGNETKAPEDGIYKVDLYTFEEEDKMTQLTKTGDWEAPSTTYYVVGDFNGWTQKDANYTMTVDADDDDLYVFENLVIESNGGLKVMDSNGSWYDGGDGQNVQVQAGTITVQFRVSTGLVTVLA